MAEQGGAEQFDRLRHTTSAGPWTLQPTEEAECILAHSARHRLAIIAGRQVQTAERVEVLALGTVAVLVDGNSLRETIAAVHSAEALAVLPWGFGKWWGRRGRLVQEHLNALDGPRVFLGDNGGRTPTPFEPSLLRIARASRIPILPGSDPLPLPHEVGRVGSFGLMVELARSDSGVARALKATINGLTEQPVTYGRLSPWRRALRTQLGLKLQRWR